MDGVAEPIAVERYADDPLETGLNVKRIHRQSASIELPGISAIRGNVFGARTSRSLVNDTIVLTLFREEESGTGTLDVATILGNPSNAGFELALGERHSIVVGDLGACELDFLGYIPSESKDVLVFDNPGSDRICIAECG